MDKKTKKEQEDNEVASKVKPTVFQISIKTRNEKLQYEEMQRPILSQKYIEECVRISKELRKDADK